ncbi:T9SS type A sorting domain-containing protein [Prolixibacteraceae bacterium JC049]|nr:T9SS type A sorting domain-containing protein [Prolixibacteraceae bacterium JC049]
MKRKSLLLLICLVVSSQVMADWPDWMKKIPYGLQQIEKYLSYVDEENTIYPFYQDLDHPQQPFRITEELMDVPINEITFPATHNSFNALNDGFKLPNTILGFEDQLNWGIRCFEIDIHKEYYPDFEIKKVKVKVKPKFPEVWETEVDVDVKVQVIKTRARIFHQELTNGILGNQKLQFYMEKLSRFMEANPNEIFFLKFEMTGINKSHIADVMKQYGLYNKIFSKEDMVYIQGEVPTPRRLIALGKRIFITSHAPDNKGWGYQYYGTPHNKKFIREITAPDAVYQGVYDRFFFTTNTYCTHDLFGHGDLNDAKIINQYDWLHSYALKCWRQNGRKPWRMIVDFPGVGNVNEVANALNSTKMLRGNVRDRNSARLDTVEWKIDIVSNSERISYTTKTSGYFNFPVQKGETVTLTPIIKGGKVAVPGSITVTDETVNSSYEFLVGEGSTCLFKAVDKNEHELDNVKFKYTYRYGGRTHDATTYAYRTADGKQALNFHSGIHGVVTPVCDDESIVFYPEKMDFQYKHIQQKEFIFYTEENKQITVYARDENGNYLNNQQYEFESNLAGNSKQINTNVVGVKADGSGVSTLQQIAVFKGETIKIKPVLEEGYVSSPSSITVNYSDAGEKDYLFKILKDLPRKMITIKAENQHTNYYDFAGGLDWYFTHDNGDEVKRPFLHSQDNAFGLPVGVKDSYHISPMKSGFIFVPAVISVNYNEVQNGAVLKSKGYSSRYYRSYRVEAYNKDAVPYGNIKWEITTLHKYPVRDRRTRQLVYRTSKVVDGKGINEFAIYYNERIEIRPIVDGVTMKAVDGKASALVEAESLTPNKVKSFVFMEERGSAAGMAASKAASVAPQTKNSTETEFQQINIYPNPVKEQVNVTMPSNVKGAIAFQLFDMQGRMVKAWNKSAEGSSQIKLELSGITRGMYVLKVNAGNYNTTKKLSVE